MGRALGKGVYSLVATPVTRRASLSGEELGGERCKCIATDDATTSGRRMTPCREAVVF
jgi:hypothetical protein